ncbi:MAG: methyltransferase domain-containing protein [Chloroflexi bacterium]|jgi:putative AdoMet-dependent methyltransferase|nr:methyltransferase domain-containing protein [Chloroflexota bacterium]
MCDANAFDHWANNYDEDVFQSDHDATFPFAGYARVLARITRLVLTRKPGKLLDIGTGSGTLAARFYQAGWNITAVDFSEEMLKQARLRMPGASFFVHDFSTGLPQVLLERSYDFIVMTYALHHLEYKEQVEFLHSLLPILRENGKILIGDIAFETQSDLDACQRRFADAWDEEEFYPVFTELQRQLLEFKIDFEVVSFCAGVIQISTLV